MGSWRGVKGDVALAALREKLVYGIVDGCFSFLYVYLRREDRREGWYCFEAVSTLGLLSGFSDVYFVATPGFLGDGRFASWLSPKQVERE